MMEDYRAGASIDLEHDRATHKSKLSCPVLVLWGENGLVGRKFDVLNVWKEYASDLRGEALPCSHYLPEEAPGPTTDCLLQFFSPFR